MEINVSIHAMFIVSTGRVTKSTEAVFMVVKKGSNVIGVCLFDSDAFLLFFLKFFINNV